MTEIDYDKKDQMEKIQALVDQGHNLRCPVGRD